MYTYAANGNYPSPIFLLSDKLHTIMQAPLLVLLVPLVSMALVLLPPGSSQILDNGPYHVPGLCTLRTIPPRTLLGKMSYFVSKYLSQDTSFSIAHGSIELPG